MSAQARAARHQARDSQRRHGRARALGSPLGVKLGGLRSVIFDAALPLENARWRHALAFRSGIPHPDTGRQPKNAIRTWA